MRVLLTSFDGLARAVAIIEGDAEAQAGAEGTSGEQRTWFKGKQGQAR